MATEPTRPAGEKRPDLSLIIALYNEEDCLDELFRRLREALDAAPLSYEVVLIDDGSHDRTIAIVERYAATDERLKLVQLSRNHGKEAAVTAGIAHASGRYLLMMDPDLQDPPERILDFYRKIEEGYDLVFGIRQEKSDSWWNVLASRLFWKLLNGLTGLDLPAGLSVMRIFNRRFADEILRYGERVRFLEGIFMAIGLRRATLPVEHHPRFAGHSHFTFVRKLRLATNAILAWSDRPIQLTVATGLVCLGSSLLWGGYLFARKLWAIVAGHEQAILSGWTSTVLLILFIGGIQILLLGILGNYVGRIYAEVKARPIFTVQRTLNLEEEAER